MNRNELFLDYKLQHELQYKLRQLPVSTQITFKSINHCKCSIIPTANCSGVEVVAARKGNQLRAHFANLYNCKSLWACPTCAAYGLMKHRDKITKIIKHWADRGYWACMVTFTVPHNRRESAATVFKRLKDVSKKVRPHLYLPESLGSVTSTEFTYSSAFGWHPHHHVLYFIPKHNWCELEAAVGQIRRRWASVLAGMGYTDDEQIKNLSVHLSTTNKGAPRKITTGDYVAKEMAKLKIGRRDFKSRTPFELIDSPDPHDFELFLEYAAATKGSSRIQYYRAICKGVDFSDTKKNANDTNTEPVTETILCVFPKYSWYEILDIELATHVRHRRRILLAAVAGGYNRILRYCEENNLPKPLPPERQYVFADRVFGVA